MCSFDAARSKVSDNTGHHSNLLMVGTDDHLLYGVP
jgi:hypothetical protein